jgi:hypothetical protein
MSVEFHSRVAEGGTFTAFRESLLNENLTTNAIGIVIRQPILGGFNIIKKVAFSF